MPKSERKLAERLALRRLYTAQLNQLRQESELLNEYELFQKENVYSKEIEHLISKESPYYELLKNETIVGRKNETYIRRWQEEEYQTNCAHPEHLLHKSLKGERLRSKSEVIIANALYMNHITILHPDTLDVYIN